MAATPIILCHAGAGKEGLELRADHSLGAGAVIGVERELTLELGVAFASALGEVPVLQPPASRT
jgi:hypothetical protein